jgi:hypothetical protein
MKVIIEIELPDGQSIPSTYDIVRLTSPDWHCDWWHVDDVAEFYAGDGEYITFTEQESREVLELIAQYNTPEIGICWDSINEWQSQIYDKYYERAEE